VENPYEIIATRRNAKLDAKTGIYKLLSDSYKGGFDYVKSEPSHLEQYDREYKAAFQKHKARSVYINFMQPIVDLLTGFVFKDEPDRSGVPASVEYMTDQASKRKGMNQFMMGLCPQAIMYTMGVLVDSPSFDPNEYATEADRINSGLKPYVCMYFPWHIRDFACDDQMRIEWVLLDDSRTIKTDPLKPAEFKKIYRLWTKTTFQDFEIKEDNRTGKTTVLAEEIRFHNLGEVPFHFVNVRDIEDDHISDSPMEDIGILGVNSAMSQAFTITKTYTPALDTERDKYKITLDVKVQNLPKNKGIDDVFPIQGKSYIRASSQREVQGLCGLFWWPEFPDIFLSDIGFPVCNFKVRLVQSVTELGENDEVPLPGDMEFQLIELLGQFFFKQRGEDKKVNANDDRTE